MNERLEMSGESFVKLSWVCIKERRMLFVRSPDGDVFFDPGCRRINGLNDEWVLRDKILNDLRVDLILPLMKLTNFGFSAPAYGKNDNGEGVMAEVHAFMGRCQGMLETTENVAEIAWFSTADMDKTSDLGKAFLQQMAVESLID